MVDSNINEIIGTDPQVQLSAYIQLEGMDQVRSNRIVNLHVMDISHSVTERPHEKDRNKFVKVVPVVINPPEGGAFCESFLSALAVPGFKSEVCFHTTVKRS